MFNDVSLNVSYLYRQEDSSSNLLYTTGQVNKETNKLPVYNEATKKYNVSVYADDQRTDENNVDVYIAAPFILAGREQEIVVGGAWNKSELKIIF